jgi:hypothetical protein
MKVLERESLGVPIAVFDLGQVLSDEIDRHVTIIAGGDMVVRRLHPTLELVSHDVAIHTRPRIVREIGSPLGVMEGEASHPQQAAQSTGKQ